MKILLTSERERVMKRAATYAKQAEVAELFKVGEETALYATGAQLRNLYDRALVAGAERPTYLKIRASSPYGRCPLCSQRDVQTVDHHLPKEKFPEFAVLPINLIPSCFPCNKAKGSHVPASMETQTFHPYFDEWEQRTLLRADIIVNSSVAVEFAVDGLDVPTAIVERAKHHFAALELGKLYAEHASIELLQRRDEFVRIFESSDNGAKTLRDELELASVNRLKPFPSAWQPVLYAALAKSDQFVTGGFYKI